MDGVLNVNKPSGPTSHDVVARLRRVTGAKRVGHAGTLDPLATGVLIVCLGNATRIVEYMSDWRKAYRATAVLGAETDTEDSSGQVVREADCSRITRSDVEAVIPRFVGRIMQVPPMVSAVHHEGRRLYELARAGKTVERASRPVEVYSLDLADFRPGDRPSFVLNVVCSGGTYIRTLCADIGRALGCGAFMSSLVRTAVGPFHIEDAVTPESVEEKTASGGLEEILHPIDEVLSDMPCVSVSSEDALRIVNGGIIPADGSVGVPTRIHDPRGTLIAIGVFRQARDGGIELKPEKVLVESADRGGFES